MRPSLPHWLFDLCLIPEHDGRYRGEHVIRIQGVLTCIAPSAGRRADEGLILVGGPSRHKVWTEARLLHQIREILSRGEVRWEIADSRRTPATTAQALARLNGDACRFRSHREAPADWLPGALARAGSVWVTEDSVSMVYEALTSGAAVGLLRLPRRRRTRVNRGIEDLVARGLVTPFERWSEGAPLDPPAAPLAEAARCAELIVERFGLGPCRSR
jgi:mitochondrial fission protein ELM1